MTQAQLSGELEANPDAVYAIVADPARLTEWDTTYGAVTPTGADDEGQPTFGIERTIANRGMRLACRVTQAQPGSAFAFECSGSAGETVRESFPLAPGDGGGTKLTRDSELTYPGQDLGVVAQTTYVEALNTRSAEQAFARLNLLLGGRAGAEAERAPGDTGVSRSEDSGTIAPEEQYSAHGEQTAVPDRPT